jgi:TRAP-type C4-dicarboxylate transport system permease small subunit
VSVTVGVNVHMKEIQSLLDKVSCYAMVAAAALLIYSVVHILLETVLRSLFSISTHVLDEFIGFSILSITFLSLAWTFRSGAMIRVSLLTSHLPSVVARYIESLVAGVAGVLALCLCTFFWRNYLKDFSRGAVSESVAEVPLWIPGLVVFVSALLLALQLILHSITKFFERQDASKASCRGN